MHPYPTQTYKEQGQGVKGLFFLKEGGTLLMSAWVMGAPNFLAVSKMAVLYDCDTSSSTPSMSWCL
jgi:hypothetical protein